MKKLILMSVIGLFFFGCGNDLDTIASFKVVPENPVKGQTVQLVNKSVNAETYMWTNGSKHSETKDWALILSASGSYTVTLQVWSKDKSKTDSKTITINVN